MSAHDPLTPDADREFTVPVRCAGCLAESEPRPLGETPEGWIRGRWKPMDSTQGRYWCPDCHVALGWTLP